MIGHIGACLSGTTSSKTRKGTGEGGGTLPGRLAHSQMYSAEAYFLGKRRKSRTAGADTDSGQEGHCRASSSG